MRRKNRFWISFSILLLAYTVPLAIAILLHDIWILGAVLACLFFSAYAVYRLSYKQKPKYPIVPPDGKPDVYYRYGIPRPIYEDVRQHPSFFEKRKRKLLDRARKIKRKH